MASEDEKQLSGPEALMASLRSLRPIGFKGTGEETRHAEFKIKLAADGEPVVMTEMISNVDSLPNSERRIINEMRRLNRGFEISWGKTAQSMTLSLWHFPYLMHLLRECEHVTGPAGERLTFSDEETTTYLRLERREGDDKMIYPRIVVKTPDAEYADPIFVGDSMVICNATVYNIATVGDNFAKVSQLLAPIPDEYLATYVAIFASFTINIIPEYDGVAARFSHQEEHALPTIILEKVGVDKALYLRVTATIDSMESAYDSGLDLTKTAMITDEGQIIIRPIVGTDIEEKADTLAAIIEKSAPSKAARREIYREENFFVIPEETAGPFLLNHLAEVLREFKLMGSDKLKEYQIVSTPPRLNVRLSSGIDFLEGDADIAIGEDKITIADLLAQFARNRYVKLSDGNRAIIDERYINRLRRIFTRGSGKDGKIRVTVFDLPEVESLIQEKIKGKFAGNARKVFEGFNKLAKAKPENYTVKATLRPYQDAGVKWIKYLYDNKLGGCLADDMGLGKTLQTIAVLSMIYPGAEEPALIIMPRSLLFNWEKEFAKFAPQVGVTTYYGPGRTLDEAMKSEVILTTYATVRNDIQQLKDRKFNYVILDESQNIKNVASQTAQAMMLLNAEHRLALSGTPMENNLTEIYSLFRFLNPAMFGSLDDFNASYTNPIQRGGDQEAISSLRRRIFPFLLRRLKRDVLDDLPERIDQTIYVEMSDRQKAFYNERRVAYLNQIHDTIARQGVNKSQFVMFQALSELRRIASIPESLTDGRIASPKITEIVESLEATVSNGHKAVVFFNFVAGIELIGERLEKLGIEFETMTGSTSTAQRKKIVGRFQTDPTLSVLLMTLKVGGVGLNLTAADTVYIAEPWWNKAAEEQAVNRLHRIGQKATVQTFSVITVDSIEEKILQLQEQKSELFDALISADTASAKHLSEADINFILS